VQSSFRYHLPVRGVEQDFICELVGLGNRNSSKYRWLALINTVDDTARDNWRIRSKNRLLFAVTQASEALMTERRFAEVMNESLYYIGNGIGVDRVYFFAAETDADSEKIYMSQKFEWCSHFVEPQIDHPELQKADMSLFKDMWAQLVNDRPYKAIVASMPDNLTREILSQQAIKSILTIPIFVRGDLWGMIGFDDCQYERNWKGVDIAILKMFAAILSARAHRVGNE
jgi:GAF domain-containing protein